MSFSAVRECKNILDNHNKQQTICTIHNNSTRIYILLVVEGVFSLFPRIYRKIQECDGCHEEEQCSQAKKGHSVKVKGGQAEGRE